MKKKTKISNLLTDQKLEKISHLSKVLGKREFLEIISQVSLKISEIFYFGFEKLGFGYFT